jgi:hypothetical protein
MGSCDGENDDDRTEDEKRYDAAKFMRKFRPERPLGTGLYLQSETQNPFPERNDIRDPMRELMADVCPACGETKLKRQSFCAKCYHVLPVPMRRALYLRFGRGYEEAHAAAHDYLRKEAKHG